MNRVDLDDQILSLIAFMSVSVNHSDQTHSRPLVTVVKTSTILHMDHVGFVGVDTPVIRGQIHRTSDVLNSLATQFSNSPVHSNLSPTPRDVLAATFPLTDHISSSFHPTNVAMATNKIFFNRLCFVLKILYSS